LKLLVTGGAGFIGSHFVRRAISGPTMLDIESLNILDSLTYAGDLSNIENELKDPRVTFYKQDITNLAQMAELFNGFDSVIHFAAESHVDRSIQNPLSFVLSNVLGTQAVLEASRTASVSLILIVSTDEVYGTINKGSWDEKSPLEPNSPYAASKASSDLLAMAAFKTYGLDVRISRCGNNYGPFQYPEKLIPLFITNLMDGLKVPIYGNGQNIRDWIHVDDHCRALESILLNGKAGEVYNIGKGEELSNMEVTALILRAMNIDDSSINYVTDRLGHDYRYSLDCAKIESKLQFSPSRKMHEEVPLLIDWYRTNTSWWKEKKDLNT
jgi:dTDP-glucose 4,6-dehydratase